MLKRKSNPRPKKTMGMPKDKPANKPKTYRQARREDAIAACHPIKQYTTGDPHSCVNVSQETIDREVLILRFYKQGMTVDEIARKLYPDLYHDVYGNMGTYERDIHKIARIKTTIQRVIDNDKS